MYNYGENPDGGSFQKAGIKDKRRCEKSIYDLMFAVLNTLRNVLIYSVTVSDIYSAVSVLCGMKRLTERPHDTMLHYTASFIASSLFYFQTQIKFPKRALKFQKYRHLGDQMGCYNLKSVIIHCLQSGSNETITICQITYKCCQ